MVRSPMGEGSSPAGHSLCATHLANSHFRPTHFSSDAIAWVVTRPPHVNIDELVIRPRAQAAQHKVHRQP